MSKKQRVLILDQFLSHWSPLDSPPEPDPGHGGPDQSGAGAAAGAPAEGGGEPAGRPAAGEPGEAGGGEEEVRGHHQWNPHLLPRRHRRGERDRVRRRPLPQGGTGVSSGRGRGQYLQYVKYWKNLKYLKYLKGKY